MSGTLFQAVRLSLILNRLLLRLLSPGALATVVRWQTGIPASVLPLIEDDRKRVDRDSLTQFVLTTDGGIVPPSATHSPVLVLVGEKETPVARSTAGRFQREIPGAPGATIRRLGHVWNLPNPNLFAKVVRRWLGGQTFPGDLVTFS
jgi:pimeloyl-ACP methyl ester carboxylesterase